MRSEKERQQFYDIASSPNGTHRIQREEKILIDLFTCKKPVIAAINGHCAAGGLIFSMASDYRIAKNHPKIKIIKTNVIDVDNYLKEIKTADVIIHLAGQTAVTTSIDDPSHDFQINIFSTFK